MGLLRNKLIKDKRKRFIVSLFVDAMLFFALIYLAHNCKHEWVNGYNYGYQECSKYCIPLRITYENVSLKYHYNDDYNNWNNNCFCDCLNYTETIYIRPEWEDIIYEFATTHKYSENYNCEDFSRDLVKLLRKKGYEAYQVKGKCIWNEPNENHAWIEIRLWYEPQNGKIISKNECRVNN